MRKVSPGTKTIQASGKATLNAAAMGIALKKGLMSVHRHNDDPNYCDPNILDTFNIFRPEKYVFPGTVEEALMVREARQKKCSGIDFPYHGYIRFEKIHRVDWEKYHQQFPAKYFGIPDVFADVISQYQGKETLEVGGNKVVAARYAYDLYVKAANAENLDWDTVKGKRFDLTFLRNAINYLAAMELKVLIKNSGAFIANTFLVPPDKKVTNQEAAVRVEDKIYHALRTHFDNIMTHSFFAYDQAFYESLGLTVLPYGRNSALVVKGLDTEAIKMRLASDIKNYKIGSLTSWGK